MIPIPLWAIAGIGAGVVAGIAGYGLASKIGDAELARAQAGWAQERTNAATKYAEAMKELNAANERERVKERMWTDVARSIDRDALKVQETQRVALVAARERIVGLQSDTNEANARAYAIDKASRDSKTAGGCAATQEAADVYSRLLNRCHQRSIERAGYCSEVVSAGERCEFWGDTLAK